MDRRRFLLASATVAGSLTAGGLLAACAKDAGSAAGTTASAGGAEAIPDGPATLAPQVVAFEVLTGGERLVPFGLRTVDNLEVADADVRVFLRDLDGEVLGGPFPAEYTEAAGKGLGLYKTRFAVRQPGPVEFVAVAGDRYGTQALNVVAPENSKAPVPGQQAVAVATPTMQRPRGVEEVCTQDPPCGMHEVSLHRSLQAGRKVMLLFATPAYCVSVTCGPAVGTVDEVRTSGSWGDTDWIHVEIYEDAGKTLTEPVQAWQLPTEPWLFGIDGSGTIVNRVEGAMLPEQVTAAAEELTQG